MADVEIPVSNVLKSPQELVAELTAAITAVTTSRKEEHDRDNPRGHAEKLMQMSKAANLAKEKGVLSEAQFETLLYSISPTLAPEVPEQEPAPAIPPPTPIPWKRLIWATVITVYLVVMILGATGKVDVSWRVAPPPGVKFVDPHNGAVLADAPQSEDPNATQSGTLEHLQSLLFWPAPIVARLLRASRGKIPKDQEEKAIVVYQMAESLTSEECIMITPEQIEKGKMMDDTVRHEVLRTSLLYHIASKKLTGICAQHVGVPVCYCVLDMRFRHRKLPPTNSTIAEPAAPAVPFLQRFQDTNDYLELFNPRVIGVSRNRIVQVHEKNVFCKNPFFAKRFEAISVEYLDHTGTLWERDFNGTHSFNLQHAMEIHRGLSTCMDDSADHLMLMMRGRIGGSPERDGFEKQMLMSNTDAHRSDRPAPPKALPAAPLPKVQ
jgi:peptide deformylase